MKFTKEQAFEKLKGELTRNGKASRMSDRTINAMLDTLIPLIANDETELDKFVTDTLPSFIGVNGNMEHDYADFVKNYKPTPKNEPNQNQEPKPNPADDVLDEMRKRLEEMEKTLKEEQLQKTINDVRVKLKDAMKTKGIKDEKWIEKYVSEICLTADLDVDAKSASALEIYNLSRAAAIQGATPFTAGGSTSVNDDKIWDDVKQKSKQNG